MREAPIQVLVLCTGNSARSILGEALFNDLGKGRIKAWSAGSQPKSVPHPAALQLLSDRGHDTSFATSKNWDVFAKKGAPELDIVVTVCDNAAGETCPIWPGHPIRAHWGLPDPAAVIDPPGAQRAAFEATYAQLTARITDFLALPVEETDPAELARQLTEIGKRNDLA